MFWDGSEFDLSKNIDKYLMKAADAIKVIALVLYYTGIRFSKKKLYLVVFLTNTLLSIPFIFEIQERFGLDYSSYLQ